MRSEFKRNFSLLLLVLTLAISALLLAVSNGFLARVGDVSVADDCSSAGAVCDGNGCRLDKGEQWCACENQCINTTGPYARQCGCQGGGGGNPTPPGNNCPTSAPTHPGCYGKPVNSSQTYGGVAGKCVINQSPHCAFVTASTPTPPTPQPPVDIGEPSTDPLNSCTDTASVCYSVAAGTYLDSYNCRCTNSCVCVGEGRGGSGGGCIGNSSCGEGLKCDLSARRCVAKEVVYEEQPTDTPQNPGGEGVQSQVVRCSDGQYCPSSQYCFEKVDINKGTKTSVCVTDAGLVKAINNQSRFAVTSAVFVEGNNVTILEKEITAAVNYPLGARCRKANDACDSGNGVCVLQSPGATTSVTATSVRATSTSGATPQTAGSLTSRGTNPVNRTPVYICKSSN